MLCPRFKAIGLGRCRVVAGQGYRRFQPQEEQVGAILLLWSLVWRFRPVDPRERLLQWMQEDDVNVDDMAEVGRWLSQKVRWENHEASRLHQAFQWDVAWADHFTGGFTRDIAPKSGRPATSGRQAHSQPSWVIEPAHITNQAPFRSTTMDRHF